MMFLTTLAYESEKLALKPQSICLLSYSQMQNMGL